MSVKPPVGLLRDLMTRIGARVIAALSQLAVYLLVARALGPSNFGEFIVAVAVTGQIAVFAGSGVASLALRVSRYQDRPGLPRALAEYGLASAFFAGLIGPSLLSQFLPTTTLLFVAGLLISSDIASEHTQAALSGIGRLGVASAMLVARRLAGLAVVAACLPKFGPEAALVIVGIVGWGIALFPVLRLPREGPGLRWMLTEARAYWFSSLAAQLMALDLLLVRALGGSVVAGLYGAAQRAAMPVNLVAGSLVGVVVPHLTHASQLLARRQVMRLVRTASAIAFLIAASSPLIAHVAVWLLGSDYQAGYWLVAGACVAAAISLVSQTYQALYFAHGDPRTVTRSVVIGSIVGLSVLAGLLSFDHGPVFIIGPILGQLVMLLVMVRSFHVHYWRVQ